ncbi:cystic fibrosis transmembrane conductance regulator [Labeo rohita]|uniref:Cystic fibrosis transmembrane conductance regulator n=1 Tax=Labeo rohita TaxID=84645 RepID=A0A498MH22_LABRO|nr:cystic fibrosis transmembrane conductance regulator [Labeo rohita]
MNRELAGGQRLRSPFSREALSGQPMWTNPIMRKGFREKLRPSDVYQAPSQDAADTLAERLEKEWDREVASGRKKPSLLRALARCFIWPFLFFGLLLYIGEASKTVQPQLLGRIIASFDPVHEPERANGYFLALGLGLLFTVRFLLLQPAMFGLHHLGMQIRIALFSIIFKKTLKLSSRVLDSISTGQLVSLMSANLGKFDQARLIWELIDVNSFCALAAISLLGVLQAFLSHKMGPYKDEVKLTRKIGSLRYFYSSAYFFSAIFVIVAAAVPHALSRGINLRRIFTTLSYCMVLRMTVTRQLPGSIQMWYDTMRLIWKIEGPGELLERIKQENKANGHHNGDAGIFFTNLYVTPVLKDISLNLKKGEMLAVTGSMGSGKSSLLMTILGELVPSSGKIRHSGRISYSSQTAWIMPGTIRDNILFGLTYDEYRYKSVVKACQLEEDLAALPEKDKTPMAEGGLNLSGGQKARVALARAIYRDADVYLLDAPFTHLDIATEKEIFDKCLCKLMASKTRILVTNKIEHLKRADKILLLHNGESFFYGTFSELQSERPDFSSLLLGLEAYDNVSAERRCSILTETLHRVSVDESAGMRPERSAFRQVAPSMPVYIDERKSSVILSTLGATRKASFIQIPEEEVRRTLPDRKFSLVPENELVDESFMGSDVYHNHGVHMAGQRRQSVLAFMTNAQGQGRRDHLQSSFRRRLSVMPQSEVASELDIYTRRLSDSAYDITGILEEENIEACLVDEIDEKEDVFETTKWNTYVRYVSNNKSLLYVLIFIFLVAAIEVAGSVAGIFLITDELWKEEQHRADPNMTKYSNMSSPGKRNGIIVTPTGSYYILYIYVATSESLLAMGFFRGLPLVHTMITISKKLHQKMLHAVLSAPMSVLNTMKTGRIMNRFTKDMATIDDMLPLLMFDFVQLTVVVVGCVLVVSIVRPYIFLVATPLAIIFIVMRKYFLRTGQQLKQLETEARSPIFSHLIISLKGLWTIRAFERQTYFENLFHKTLNTHTATWFLYLSTLRWFLFRSDILFVFFFTLTAWIAVGTNQDKPGEIGIVICLAMLILGTFQWCVATSIAVDGMMRSVDRVFKFIDLPSETPKPDKSKCSDLIFENVDPRANSSWPNRGQIDVRNLTVRYTEGGHTVLKNLSFTAEGGQRVGILGRTGSGKSSLFNALLKLVYTDGEISIDGVNWNNMPLQKWRKAFGVVPQKVFIFTGPFRMNLDPYGCHSDEELWRVTEEVGLKTVIEQFPDKLDFHLEYGGYVLSNGHKQLICLARSILSGARILLLDEPSAHLDPVTIKVLKKTLRQSFSTCTILLSEHKVEPLLECQSFLMMDKGQVKTYDSIQKLLNETSHLKQAISPAERLKLFPRRNSSMRTPQNKLSSVTQTLQEEAEDNVQDTRL